MGRGCAAARMMCSSYPMPVITHERPDTAPCRQGSVSFPAHGRSDRTGFQPLAAHSRPGSQVNVAAIAHHPNTVAETPSNAPARTVGPPESRTGETAPQAHQIGRGTAGESRGRLRSPTRPLPRSALVAGVPIDQRSLVRAPGDGCHRALDQGDRFVPRVCLNPWQIVLRTASVEVSGGPGGPPPWRRTGARRRRHCG